jgi:hypothetical protein
MSVYYLLTLTSYTKLEYSPISIRCSKKAVNIYIIISYPIFSSSGHDTITTYTVNTTNDTVVSSPSSTTYSLRQALIDGNIKGG